MIPVESEEFGIASTAIEGLMVIERRRKRDARGFFSRLFSFDRLAAHGWPGPIAQINQSFTAAAGTARGLHFQKPPHAESKLVGCMRGEVFDVAVDLRRGSPTFLQWHGELLSGENGRSLLIPEGFAHGFQCLSDGCELLYLHSHPYTPAAEGGLGLADPRLAIDWPLPLRDISARDQGFKPVDDSFPGLLI